LNEEGDVGAFLACGEWRAIWKTCVETARWCQ